MGEILINSDIARERHPGLITKRGMNSFVQCGVDRSVVRRLDKSADHFTGGPGRGHASGDSKPLLSGHDDIQFVHLRQVRLVCFLNTKMTYKSILGIAAAFTTTIGIAQNDPSRLTKEGYFPLSAKRYIQPSSHRRHLEFTKQPRHQVSTVLVTR